MPLDVVVDLVGGLRSSMIGIRVDDQEESLYSARPPPAQMRHHRATLGERSPA